MSRQQLKAEVAAKIRDLLEQLPTEYQHRGGVGWADLGRTEQGMENTERGTNAEKEVKLELEADAN